MARATGDLQTTLSQWTTYGTLAGQLVTLREALTDQDGMGAILTRALPVRGEGTLLGPTIAGVVQLFRPPRLRRRRPARFVLPAQPMRTQRRGVQRLLALPSPAVMPDPPPHTPAELSS